MSMSGKGILPIFLNGSLTLSNMEKQSQHDIESLVYHFFREPGTFLEIGCWHGVHISNTAYLEQQHGWKGWCVDPFPHGFETRKCTVIDKAVSADGGQRKFVRVSTDKDNGGDVSYLSGFEDTLKKHSKFIKDKCEHMTVTLNTISVADLMAPLPKFITYLSIDTEGSEVEILKAIDFEQYSFGIIDVEHNKVAAARKEIRKVLEAAGYVLLKELDINDVYINKSHGSNH